MSHLPTDTYDYDVFIHYSTADKAWVRGELLTRLQKAGLRVCIDYEDFRPGAPAIKEIKRAAMTSRKTLLVLTPNYLESGWTEFERYLLQTPDPNNTDLRLLPVLKEACALPPDISYLSYVDFTDPEELDIAWKQVFRAFGIVEAEVAPPREYTPKQWFLAHPYGMPPHFTGRVAERQLLSDWLNQGPQPLLVLRALGGFGKSALTWHWLLHDVAERDWPVVVWWSFYEEKAGFDNFVSATLAYLRQKPEDLKPSEQVRRLLEYVQQHRILLVLDGFERELRAYGSLGAAYQGDGEQEIADTGRDCVNPGAELFLRNLASLPNLQGKVLMSTRLRPRPVEVTGGALLLGCRELELTQMQAADAVAFFQVQGIRGNADEINQVCEALDYHPVSLHILSGLILQDLKNPGEIKAAKNYDLGEIKTVTAKKYNLSIFSEQSKQKKLSIHWQKRRSQCFTEPVINLDLMLIPDGTFIMGSPEDELGRWEDEGPQHEVTVFTFLMGRYPINQAQWRTIATRTELKVKDDLKLDPSKYKGDDRPVEQVSWHDAVEFCARLSKLTGHTYRLPAEAKWEYACRGETKTPFHFGETITTDLANYRGEDNEDNPERYPGNYGNGPKGVYRKETTIVNHFYPLSNAFGLCDLHGNVWEWCLDYWHGNYKGAPADGSAWLTKNSNNNRVVRGGSCGFNPRKCRSASRNHYDPNLRDEAVGFRVLCEVQGL